MEESKKYLKKKGLLPLFECRIRSKSNPNEVYTLGYYGDKGWECSCIAGTYRHPCHHKQTAQKHYLEEAKQNFKVK